MVLTQAKRKKTADMPDSPPKRVTRARAAKATDDGPAKPKTTKITTASTKAAAEKKKATVPAKAAAPAKATKRKSRAEDEDAKAVKAPQAPDVEDPVVEEQQETEPTKPKGRQRKATVAEQEKIQLAEAPKVRGRQTKSAAAVESDKPEASKTRGRPKKAPEPMTGTVTATALAEDTAQVPAKKVTRGRTAAATTKASLTTSTSKSTTATAPSKKKVKFEEDNDKENVPVEKAAPKRPATKPTGLTAKPIRKPTAVRATTRGKRAAPPETKTAKKTDKVESMPLSPKKVNQVAKSDPISEDELAGEKTPVRAFSKSPTKRPMSPITDVGSVSKLNFDLSTAPSSPAKPLSTSVLGSPARRPPPSPFKDALKTSPMKLNFGDSMAQPVLVPSRTPMKASLLQESPKRGGFADSAVKPILLPSKSPFKASLLQSPARRPNASPMKSATTRSPERCRPDTAASNTPPSPTKASPGKATEFFSEETVTSPFRAARSPERRAKVRVITQEEQGVEQGVDVTEGSTSPSPTPSPEKRKDASEATPHLQDTDAALIDSVTPEESTSVKQPNSDTDEDGPPEDLNLAKGPAPLLAPAFAIGSSSLRRTSLESESSEDELASPQKIYEITPLKSNGISARDFVTPAVLGGQGKPNLSFTPLADQLSSWNPSSPDGQARSRQARGMFSFGASTTTPIIEQPIIGTVNASPAKSSFFDDEMAMRSDDDHIPDSEMGADSENVLAALKVSQDSQASDEYGDENAEPAGYELFMVQQENANTITCTPAKVFTPARPIRRPGEMHTVSKVPLRPSAEETPLNVPRQRSRSFGGPLAVVDRPESAQTNDVLLEQPATPLLAPSFALQTPSSGMKLDAETPGRTVRKGVVPDVLKGAVVHVDVHTTEGADASGIFVDLLTQMGARCVKQWHWNPRASTGGSRNSTASPQGPSPDATASKIGITHVVYKDGGKRTLEKVRSSNGVVHCVGVGWVLDCEREDKWLDEAEYAIDTSLVPRGGSRRRKSMEPRALANMNGNLVPASSTETPAKPSDISPTKEFLTFDTPASRRESFVIDPAQAQVAVEMPTPATPVAVSVDDDILEDGSTYGSPTTPYYLRKGAKLVQQTCPPKRLEPMSLFPVTGKVEDQPDETVRRRLLEARRKSLQWSSRIRSPLGRTVSYGK